MKPISQSEARRLRRRVRELEDLEQRRLNHWKPEWPDGTHLITMTGVSDATSATIDTALKLKHYVVCKLRRPNELLFFASNIRDGEKP